MRPDVNFYRKVHSVRTRGFILFLLTLLTLACVSACGEDIDCGWTDENTYIDTGCEKDKSSTQTTTTTTYRTTTSPETTTTTQTTTTTARTTQETVIVLPPTTITRQPPTTVTVTVPPAAAPIDIKSDGTSRRCGAQVLPGVPYNHFDLEVSLDMSTHILHFNKQPEGGAVSGFAISTDSEYPSGRVLGLDQGRIGTGPNQSLDFHIQDANFDYVLVCT